MISSVGGGSSPIDALAQSAQSRAAGFGAVRGRPGGDAKPSITMRTQEGDTVTITRKQPQSVTYGRSGGSLASTGLVSNDQFDVQMTGSLSDTEKADIQAVLEKMDSARASMESGDFSSGMKEMRSAMEGGGTVSSVEGPGGPPPGMPSGNMEASGMHGTASGTSAANDLSSLLDSSDDDASSSSNQTSASAKRSSSSSTSSAGLGSLDSLIESLRTRDYSELRGSSTRS